MKADYLQFLNSMDSEVYYNASYQTAVKPFVGIVIMVADYHYFIPLTSAKMKHTKWKNVSDECFLIYEILKNERVLDGYICKEPIYRKTPLGREIADLLLAVNRPYGKSDYIPCICWGRNARYASGFGVGDRCALWGRIQSREYMKRLGEEELEKRIAYEVSVSKLELMEL